MPVSRREWGLFGVRWMLPVAVLVYAFLVLGIQNEKMQIIVVLISVGAIITNLVISLLLVSNYWAGFVTILTLVIDAGLVAGAVYATDLKLAWIGLLPAAVAGLYFDWIVGLVVGVVIVLVLIVLQIFGVESSVVNIPLLIFLVTAYPAAGPLAAMLGQNSPVGAERKPRTRRAAAPRRKQPEPDPLGKQATEYMAVVYEMAEVLSASRLDPSRVMASAVSFGIEGLERVGVESPLFGAVLLFADSDDGMSTVLRIAKASNGVNPYDYNVIVPGAGGVIAKAINQSEVVLTNAPGDDDELKMFSSFGMCKSGMVLPMASGKDTYGVMIITSQKPDAFSPLHVDLMTAVANQAAASLNNAKLYVSLRDQRDRIVEVENSARAQLAADLHDGPTQAVSAITMRLNYIRRLLEKKPEDAASELYQIEELSRNTAKEIRAMLFTLRPKSLEQGLANGLEQLALQMADTYGQKIEVQVANQSDKLLDSQSTQTLFSIVTEAVNNARKHAGADVIRINAGTQGDVFTLTISDDGKGFDVAKALAEAKQREGHLGLINLKERAALVEGNLDIQSAPGQGTRMTVTIPLDVLRFRKEEEAQREMEGV